MVKSAENHRNPAEAKRISGCLMLSFFFSDFFSLEISLASLLSTLRGS